MRPDQPIQSAGPRLVLLLGGLMALGPLTMDMYLPALPDIRTDLHASGTVVQLTLTGTLVGLGLGQLVIGPLSDALGRKRPLVVGTLLHVVASLLCAVAPNIAVLGVLRVVQGLGAAAATVIVMAMVRDMFSGRAAAVMLSRMVLVLGAAPVLAPSVGSGVLSFTNWRGIFVTLAASGLLLLVVQTRVLPETLPPERRRPTGGVRGVSQSYGRLLRDRTFVGLAASTGLAVGSVFAYVSAAPFVVQDRYGLSEQQFGGLFAISALALVIGPQLNARLLRWFTPYQLMSRSLGLGVLLGLVMVVVGIADPDRLVLLYLPIWVMLLAVAAVLPNGPAMALELHGQSAGTAAAVVGAGRFGLAAIAAPVVGLLGNGSAAMGIVMLGSVTLSLGTLLLMSRPGLKAHPEVQAAAAEAELEGVHPAQAADPTRVLQP